MRCWLHRSQWTNRLPFSLSSSLMRMSLSYMNCRYSSRAQISPNRVSANVNRRGYAGLPLGRTNDP